MLVWDDSIGEGDIILASTNSLVINDDNNITNDTDNINKNTNEIFSDKNIIIKKTSRQEIMVKENTSEEIFKQLNTKNNGYDSIDNFDGLDSDIKLNDPSPLFVRIDKSVN